MENELGIPCYGALMIMRRGKILDTRDLTRGSRLTQPYRTLLSRAVYPLVSQTLEP